MNEIYEHKNVRYAASFVAFFAERFRDMREDGSFEISRKEFFKFMHENGFMPEGLDRIPDSADPAGFRYLCQHAAAIRHQMNTAARFGRHGEPPFEAVVMREHRKQGRITIRNRQQMVTFTHNEVAEKIRTFVDNRFNGHDAMIQEMMDEENFSQLPAALQVRVVAINSNFKRTVDNMTHILNGHVEDTKDLIKEAERLGLLEGPERPQLEHQHS